MVEAVLTRKQALVLAWKLFWFATGSRAVGVSVTRRGDVQLAGANRLGEN